MKLNADSLKRQTNLINFYSDSSRKKKEKTHINIVGKENEK